MDRGEEPNVFLLGQRGSGRTAYTEPMLLPEVP
jgi:hypothetical protein